MAGQTLYTPYWKALKNMVRKMTTEEILEAEAMMERLAARIKERKEVLARHQDERRTG